MTRVVTPRRALCLAAACIMGGTTLFGSAAQAAVGGGPGGLTLNPTSGSTTATPMGAAYTSANACPAGFRESATVGIFTEEDNPRTIALTGSFVPSATPPSGTLNLGASLGGAMDVAHLPSGDYQLALVCSNDNFDPTVAANVWVHVDLEAKTWKVIDGGGNPGAVTTTTTLAANPTTVSAGQAVTLTATVTGAGAAGTVEFLDGSTSLGTATVSGGTATKTVDTLAAGPHSLTAKFVPTDPAAFTPSTSAAVSVTVTSGNGGGSQGSQQVNVTVPQGGGGTGSLTMQVDSTPVSLAQVSGGDLVFKGNLSAITVTDDRDQLAGWSVKGQTSDFTGGGHSIDGKQLGWTPAVTTQNQAGDVVKGSAVAPANPGLKQPATLASASAGKGAGTTKLGGSLELDVPASTAAGSYSATLTVTLMSP